MLLQEPQKSLDRPFADMCKTLKLNTYIITIFRGFVTQFKNHFALIIYKVFV